MDIEKIVREYIDKSLHLSLGTSADNKPWVCEVHFAYDDHLNIYFVSKLTTRHCLEITVNPHIAGNIVKQHKLEDAPIGIYFEGTAGEIDPTNQQLEIYCSRLKRDKTDLTAQLKEKDGRRMYKISVSNWAVFGKFGLDANQKHELKWGNK